MKHPLIVFLVKPISSNKLHCTMLCCLLLLIVACAAQACESQGVIPEKKEKNFKIDIPDKLKGVMVTLDGPVLVNDIIEEICQKHEIKVSLVERRASDPREKEEIEYSPNKKKMNLKDFLVMIANSKRCDVSFEYDDFLGEHVLWVRGGKNSTLVPIKTPTPNQ